MEYAKPKLIQILKNESDNGNICGEFQCYCGRIFKTRLLSVKSGHCKSCGCLQKQYASKIGKLNKTHGHTINGKHSRTHHIWIGMRRRCNNHNDSAYKDYGGRGIAVCERWNNKKTGYINFLNDIGEIPESKTIDRIENNGNYCPENYKLSTMAEQSRNRRTNHLLKYDNKELCFAEWEEITGIKQATIRYRIKVGWSVRNALTIPADTMHNKKRKGDQR